MAERVGFEPTARCRVTGFQDQLLKPLGHLSIFTGAQTASGDGYYIGKASKCQSFFGIRIPIASPASILSFGGLLSIQRPFFHGAQYFSLRCRVPRVHLASKNLLGNIVNFHDNHAFRGNDSKFRNGYAVPEAAASVPTECGNSPPLFGWSCCVSRGPDDVLSARAKRPPAASQGLWQSTMPASY